MNPLHSLGLRTMREEEMDAGELPDTEYARVLHDLSRINRLTLAARPTLAFVRTLLAGTGDIHRPLRILDVGFGHGDMLRAIARMCAELGRLVDLVGIDLNPRSATSAQGATPTDMPIRWITGDYQDYPVDGGDAHGTGEPWDAVISSLVAHHMSAQQRNAFLCFMETYAQRGWLVNDLHRQRLPFVGYPVLATLAMVDPIVRRDGQLSIARSFRHSEWLEELASAQITGASVKRWFPWRLVVERIK